MKNEINAFKKYLNSIINDVPSEVHEKLWENLLNMSEAYQKILNGEIRESCGEFLKNFTIVSMEPDIAEASQKVVDDILFKNSQERT